MKTSPDLRQRLGFLATGFAVGVLALGIWVAVWSHVTPSASVVVPARTTTAPANPSTPTRAIQPLTATVPAAAPASDPAVIRVAARFHCVCPDKCAQPLDRCQCATATAERAYIAGELQAGRSEADTAKALNQKYGGLRL